MCAIVNSSLLLIMTVICCLSVVTVGLPSGRREHGTYQDVLSGPDFLSVFMRANYRQMYPDTTTRSAAATLANTLRAMGLKIDEDNDDNHLTRGSRSTSYLTSTPTQTFEEDTYETKIYPTPANYGQARYYGDHGVKLKSPDDGVIVAVSVSSSVGQTINKPMTESNMLEETTNLETTTETATLMPTVENLIVSEERPSIVVEANKSEFSVEEGEPITKISGISSEEYSGPEYPASVQALPSPHSISTFRSNNDYISQQHQTVIFHGNPQEDNSARSVSYSTVIQAVPNQHQVTNWNDNKMQQEQPHHERQERHYEGTQVGYANSYDKYTEKNVKLYDNFKNNQNNTQMKDVSGLKHVTPIGSMAETKEYYVTSKYNPPDYNESADKKPNKNNEQNWEKPEEHFVNPETSSRKPIEPTERNWEVQAKPYIPPTNKQNSHVPIIYGQSEQNYEVDESVSVMTNGRTHGVQQQTDNKSPPLLEVKTGQSSKKTDDNQKVGYVVEGRNYRKYRVEERTSDGFIVGEYGVVSHDDGSLRGVRYTADGTINPRLIYDALMKFLSL